MSPEERETLILQYAHLVRYVVGRIMVELPRHVDRDDLIGHGTIGLIRAVDKFDPRRGVKFETYAISVIRGAVLEALRQDDWVFIPPHEGPAINKTTKTELGNSDTDQLYDLSQDIGQVRNVAAEHGDIVRDMAARLKNIRQGHSTR